MKLTKSLMTFAAAAISLAGFSHAQNVQMVGLGSSALFLEMGQAAALSPSIGASCSWTVGKGTVSAIDNRAGVGLTEAGQAWVTWGPGSGTCAAPAGSYNVYAYLQTDSTVGNRCILAAPACTMTFPVSAAGTAGAGLLSPVSDTPLPAAVRSALSGASFNTSGTDIRPEDAKFATNRALTDCGTPVTGVAGSQYLGLGYAVSPGSHIGTAIKGSTAGGGSSFNVVDFNLTGSDPISGNAVSKFAVYDVGAVPVVVFVNPGNQTGFGSLLVQNLPRAVLAGYLDGTYGRTSDAISETYSSSNTTTSTVFLREPLSGTYNTMEYSIPNNVQLQSSQDVGLNTGYALGGLGNNLCSGVTVNTAQNPLNDAASRGSLTSYRYRAIGTGNEIAAVLSHVDSLGYSFWGASNFKNANASNAKYLQVDGLDPIQESWTDGLVPTAGNGLLGNVSFANVKNGSYPIWTKLRLATTVTTSGSGASLLATAAQTFVSPSQPDFIPISQLLIVRSHFAPPFNASSAYDGNFVSSGTNQPANGTAICNSGTPEAGGDVAGLVYTLQSDGAFCYDTGSTYGQVGRRQ
jgi:hypothetical protein